uniref:PGG domain-containing protein n=2 Tax=Opuntia streptacantha TaxID=393608 RepID=A0A7C9F7L0_OPUST
MDLIAEKCRGDDEWVKWCKHVRINPVLKLTYAQQTKKIFELRGVLFVVATLLATITFQAGFTLPGGLNQNSGEAILAKKAAFLMFLLTDALSLLCSVCALFCLTCSFFCESEKTVRYSMIALIPSLGWSLLAFASGVSTVIPHGWGNIIIWVFFVLLLVIVIIGAAIYPALLANMLPGKVSTLMDNISKKFGRRASASMNESYEANSTQEHAV